MTFTKDARLESSMQNTIPILLIAAFAEIGGCFAFWAYLRSGRTALWLLPGLALLALFAWLLTRTEFDFAGRAYAAYGGIYILSSLLWLWGIEGMRPNRWDLVGAGLALLGAIVILLGSAVETG